MSLCGYGKILEVNLSTRDITKRDITPRFAREYVGGMGFSCKVLYDEVGPEVDPLSPENVLIFANGPLTGTQAPCSGRTEITNKSPLTDSIGTGNTGGMWGTRLRRAGFDMIVVRNQAEKPVYLWIDDDFVEIRDAAHLWGKDTEVTTTILHRELGTSSAGQVSVLTIGPAGEHLVRYACPLNDYHHTAARGGAGAVMGAKKLKAIAVRGTGNLRVGRPHEFGAAAKEARERILLAWKAADDYGGAKMSGAPSEARQLYLERGCLPAKNFQTGILPHWIETRGVEAALKYLTKTEAACYACPIPCFKLAEVKEGRYAGTKANRGIHPGLVIEWGAKCAINNLPAIWRCKELCQKLGMDYASAAGVISFAMELFQRELITINDTDGLELRWGNEDAAIETLHRIAYRKGFGDILAEGSLRAARTIGKGTERYAMVTKGMEMMSLDPRSGLRGFVFGDLTNPRGGDNVKTTHFGADKYHPAWWIDKFDMFDDVKEGIYGMPPQEVSFTWDGKPLMSKWFEDLFSILNSLGLCFFPSSFNLAIGPNHLSKLYSAYTGWDIPPKEIMRLGEKVFTLLKAYTARQGLTRRDDTWPDRFFVEPMPEGPAKGTVLSREKIGKLLDEYYELRGWDRKLGVPTDQKLRELGLIDIADDLIKRGKIAGRA